MKILLNALKGGVRDYGEGEFWNNNQWIKDNYGGDMKSRIKVSFVFDLLSRTAEESSAFLSRIIDKVMSRSHSQLDAPNFFYKAIMYSGMATIEDESFKELIDFYTEECFEEVLLFYEYKKTQAKNRFNDFFNKNKEMDQKLSEIMVRKIPNQDNDCLDIKSAIRENLKEYAIAHHVKFVRNSGKQVYPIRDEAAQNMHMANMLVNHYLDKKESAMGIMKGSQLPGTMGRVFQYFNRLYSFDAALSFLGLSDLHGASEAAARSQKFSEHLARAPHVAGWIKMLLVAVFPFLIFFVVAGKWQVLIYWFVLYLSVLLWTPLWVLLYHIMTNIAQSVEVLEELGHFSDGVSLYGARLVRSRIYYFYSIYSWIQLLVATLTTGGAFFFLRPMLMENKQEAAPEFVGGANNTAGKASTAVKAVGGIL